MEEMIYWIWLAGVRGIGSRRKAALLAMFGDPETLFHVTEEELIEAGDKREAERKKLISQQDLKLAEKAAAFMEKEHIFFTALGLPDYPEMLKDIYDPPTALFMKGDTGLLERKMTIAIVGSRQATPGGLSQARSFGQALSDAGVTVVSGMADGIDAASHWGALSGGIGSTIAVLGTGVNLCYPQKNRELYHAIEEKGLLLSEFFMDSPPEPYHFPRRNRIISGLSRGILVVEAGKKSGALITVDHALDQGKNVYAIPQDIHLNQSVGSNALLKEGAKVVTEPSDILEDFGSVFSEKQSRPESEAHEDRIAELSGEEREIYTMMLNGYLTVDELELVSGVPIQKLNSILMMMELKDLIKVEYGRIALL